MVALIGAGRVTLSADTTAFHSGMKRAEGVAKTTSNSINKSFSKLKGDFFKGFASGLAGAISLTGIVAATRSALEYAGSLGEVAQQLGVTTRELQTFRFAVQQNGGTVENADQALGKFAITISKALEGSEKAAAAFKAAGVELSDLQNKSKSEVLEQIADRFKATGGASANAAAGVAIFGKGFQKIIPVLDQGSIGMRAAAEEAEKFGLVLSDKEIQEADVTADKIDKLMTAFKVKIASEVSQNAGAIGELITTLAELVGWLERARAALVNFQQNYNLPNLLFKGEAFGNNVAGSKVTTGLSEGGAALSEARKRGLKIAGAGVGVGGTRSGFLASGGGGKSKKSGSDDAMRKQLGALSDQFRFEEDIRRAQLDVLRAQESLATDYSERARLAIEQLNLEKQSYEAELAYQVEAYRISKGAEGISQAQADQLKTQYDLKDSLERQLVLREEEERRQRDYAMLEDRDFDARREMLERQAELANNYQERRDVEMRILDLAYEEERNRLNRIIRESQDWAEIEAARRDLLDLTRKQSADREITRRNTAGPFESAQMDFSDLTDEMENLRVNGIMATGDALATLATEGFGDFKDQAISAIKQIIAEFIRLQTIKFLFSMLGSATGSPTAGLAGSGLYSGIDPLFLGGFASGGFTGWGSRDRIAGFVHGQEGVLNTTGLRTLGIPNLNALNSGAPLAAVSNDNGMSRGGGGDMHVHIGTLGGGMSPFEGRQTGRQLGRGLKERVAYGATGRRATR